MRALRDEDPGFCADSLLADIEDFYYQKPISDKQLDKAYNLLISDKFTDYIRSFFPQIDSYREWQSQFQEVIKEVTREPEENNQVT